MKQVKQLFLLVPIILCYALNTTLACESNQPTKQRHLFFTENKGQWPQQVKHQAIFNDARLFLEQDRLTWLLIDPNAQTQLHDYFLHQRTNNNKTTEVPTLDLHAFSVHFEGARPQARIRSSCDAGFYHNYYLGKDPSKWASDVNNYHEVRYESLYTGIDLQLYNDDGGLKYDFIVASGADAKQIGLRYEHADEVFVKKGQLHIRTSVNTMIEEAPFAYQYIDKKMVQVPCEFKVIGNTVRFHFPKGYDTTTELIIDPRLVFASYSGSYADNFGFTATYDQYAQLYGGGVVFGFNYPVTDGAFQINFNGIRTDMGISKFSSQGRNLLYSTYIGGSTGNETPHSMIVNSQNELVILGVSGSDDYPVTSDAFDKSYAGGNVGAEGSLSFLFNSTGSDIVVTKLNNEGTRLKGSTYLGGSSIDGLSTAANLAYNYADDLRGEVFLDGADNIYVSSATFSRDLPKTSNSFQPDIAGSQDGCVFKLNQDLSELEWASYLGGSARDAAYSMKVAADGSLFVSGGTDSPDFPTTTGAYLEDYQGGDADGYIAKISNDGTTIEAATFLGTSDYDQTYFVDIDAEGNVYTVGQTEGDYPVIGDVYSNDSSGQFIHKLNNDLSETIVSTIFGRGDGDPDISPSAFLVDKCNKIYVSGWGASFSGSGLVTFGLPVTDDAFQSTTDGSDFYFIVLDEDAKALLYATYFGGYSDEHVDGGTSRFDKEGLIYQAVCAGCGGSDSFPTTDGAYSETNNSTNCNLGVIKFAFEASSVIADFEAPAQGCVPLTVEFQNTTFQGEEYEWEVKDPNNPVTSNELNLTHTFNEPGMYEVSLIATSENTCNNIDVITKTIEVIEFDEVPTQAAFEAPIDGCAPYTIDFLNKSIKADSFEWDFGDPNNPATSTLEEPSFTYEEPGEYEVTLRVFGDETCNKEDEITKTVVIQSPNIDVEILGVQDYCYNEDIQLFEATEPGGRWSGNGILFPTAGQFFPTLGPGNYTVTYTIPLDLCDAVAEVNFNVYAQPAIIPMSLPYCTEVDSLWAVDFLIEGTEIDYVIDAAQTVTVNEVVTLSFPITGDTITPRVVMVEGLASGCSAQIEFIEPACVKEEPPCEPSAGIVEIAPIEWICTGGMTGSVGETDAVIEEGQALFYVFHSVENDTIDQVYLISDSDQKTLAELEGSGILVNQMFYISPIVAEVDADTGQPIFNDCTAFSLGRSYVFLKPITYTIDESCGPEYGDTEGGDLLRVTIRPSGGLPEFDQLYEYIIGGDRDDFVSFGGAITLYFNPETTFSYELQLSGGPNCQVINIMEDSPIDCRQIPAPIGLLDLSIKINEGGNTIAWEVVSETNNDFYTIERSSDGLNFYPITTIKGAGTSTEYLNYIFTDEVQCGQYYYRLSWTDYNGQVLYAPNTLVANRGEAMAQLIELVPSLASDMVQLRFQMDAGQPVQIKVFDIAGRIVHQKQLVSNECLFQHQFSVSEWPTGTYFVSLTNGQKQLQTKLMKD